MEMQMRKYEMQESMLHGKPNDKGERYYYHKQEGGERYWDWNGERDAWEYEWEYDRHLFEKLMKEETILRSRQTFGKLTEVRNKSSEPQEEIERFIQFSLAPFAAPSSPITIRAFCALILQHKSLADCYIESLSHTGDKDNSFNCLTLALRLPRQADISNIAFWFPTGLSEVFFWYHYGHDAVSFKTHSPVDPTTERRRVDFHIKPTMLFLHRIVELFFEEVGPTRAVDGNLFCGVTINVLGHKFNPRHDSHGGSNEAIQLRDKIIDRFCEHIESSNRPAATAQVSGKGGVGA